jgi:hypothetical protein
MTALDFLQHLESRGVVVATRGAKLIVDAPAGALTAVDRAMLARHKAELLALLAGMTTPTDLSPNWHLLWDERAAILEYEGRHPRERAEALALVEIVRQMRRLGVAVAWKKGSSSGP